MREFGKTFENFVEVNLESSEKVRNIFEKDLHPDRILRDLSLLVQQDIIPGKTLLFLDEIQASPRAFLSLRYFYEELPNLHVIAAGSLLDFTIQQIGIPVGRVSSLYIYPMSFYEFLLAMNADLAAEAILIHNPKDKIGEPIHTKLLEYLAEYLAVGGMPAAIKCWKDQKNPRECFQIHQSLIDAYKQDFDKYAKDFQIKYLKLLFERALLKIGKKFKYSSLGDYRKRELEPCLDLLVTAGIMHKIYRTDGNEIPLGVEFGLDDFKVIFVDIALTQALLNINLADWLLNPLQDFINKGEIIEAFIGQELIAYSDPYQKAQLYYWRKNEPSSQAEVDYLIQKNNYVIPTEVKSGATALLKSLKIFLENRPKSPYGIRFSINDYSIHQKVYSYPLYAVYGFLRSKV